MYFDFSHVIIEPDKQIGLHSQGSWELSWIIRGRGVRMIGGIEAGFIEGDLVLVPPGMMHVWEFSSSSTDGLIENISLSFDKEVLESIGTIFPELANTVMAFKEHPAPIVFIPEQKDRIIPLLEKMYSVSPEKRPSLFLELLPEISPSEAFSMKGAIAARDISELRMERIATFVRCNFSRKITIDEIASYVAMSKGTFCSFFKRRTGKTFMEYLTEHRVSIAQQLLRDSRYSIADISAKCGFSTPALFSRTFKNVMGIKPTDAR